MRRGFTLGFAIGLAVLTMGPSAAQATFPGKNGRILTATLGCTVKDCSPVPFMLSFNPDGSQLASFPGTDRFGGVFSPDGTKVAYFSASPLTVGAPNYVVTVSAPDGSGQQQLLPTAVTGWSQLGAFSTRLSWLPDGKHLTYDGPEGTLWETDLTGLTQPVLLLPNKPGVYLAGVSPDGKQVAYVDTNGSTLYVASFPLGLDAHPIATYPAGISAPQWSPDSKQLIFSTGQTRQIIETAADGTNVRTVGSGALPTWSPDGKSIAFGDPVNNGHMIANTDGSNPQTFPGIINIGADWQALP